MVIVVTLVAWLIASVVFAWLLSISVKILDGKGADFGDCFQTSIAAIGVGLVLDWIGAFDSEAYGWLLQIGADFLIWSVCISMFIGLTLGRSLLVALVFTGLKWVLGFVMLMIIASAAL